MKYAAMVILAVGYIACGAWYAHMARDDARETRWRYLQQRENSDTLTVDERAELQSLNRWAASNGERNREN
jgi:hypothetical protein